MTTVLPPTFDDLTPAQKEVWIEIGCMEEKITQLRRLIQHGVNVADREQRLLLFTQESAMQTYLGILKLRASYF